MMQRYWFLVMMGVHGLYSIIVYIEYQSVCPFVKMGAPTPSPTRNCVSPPAWTQRGRATLTTVVGEGVQWGTQFERMERKPGTLYTLCF
jgi:hypothetical protein